MRAATRPGLRGFRVGFAKARLFAVDQAIDSSLVDAGQSAIHALFAIRVAVECPQPSAWPIELRWHHSASRIEPGSLFEP
jgi:hypothetical protein